MPPFPSLEDLGEELPRWFYDASLLFRRMALNHVDRAEVEENDPLLFYELQGFCTLCPSKEKCVVDLANDTRDDSSKEGREYCPNATTLVALEMQQNCTLAGAHGKGDERIVVTKLGSATLWKAKGE